MSPPSPFSVFLFIYFPTALTEYPTFLFGHWSQMLPAPRSMNLRKLCLQMCSQQSIRPSRQVRLTCSFDLDAPQAFEKIISSNASRMERTE